MEEMKLAFELFDENKDGLLTTKELVTAMRSLEHDPNLSIQDLIRKLDLESDSGEGTLNFDEFVKIVCLQLLSYYSSDDAREDFNKIDEDGNGKITRDELKKYLAEFDTTYRFLIKINKLVSA
jgi:Ca2+-binding EF-hand superfamily protein